MTAWDTNHYTIAHGTKYIIGRLNSRIGDGFSFSRVFSRRCFRDGSEEPMVWRRRRLVQINSQKNVKFLAKVSAWQGEVLATVLITARRATGVRTGRTKSARHAKR